ncbi:hypothetical protein MYX76_13975 [Desulfobacterota bacterium AH_259_B03_O07]|nr:hypothetical protein [Desulfobacterota bacterium AH_259_B03_O07]
MIKEDLLEELNSKYQEKKYLIRAQLRDFQKVFEKSDDHRIFEELVFCILTSAAGPKMGLRSVNALKNVLMDGNENDLYMKLVDVHKYPDRSSYIVHTREYLKREFDFKLRNLILSFSDLIERRDFFANNKDIKGIGYVQASHFLRNIGYFGYAILDKNILRSLYDAGVIYDMKPPTTKKKYLDIEKNMKSFAEILEITIDELDLLLWSEKTGHIPK